MKPLAITLGALCITVSCSAQIAATVLLQGVVLDAETRKGITSNLTLYDQRGTKVNETRSNASDNGAYQVIVKPGGRYVVELRAEGYMTTRDTVTVPPATRYTELSRDFTLRAKNAGQRLVVSIPLFEGDKATLRVGAEEELARYAELLSLNPDVKLGIECYPDHEDTRERMAELARKRAEAIRAFLSARGIAASRLSIITTSMTDPYNPPPRKLRPKGRFYTGGTYFVIEPMK
ncbi:MAG: hypothetical protein KatS3mg038_3438 [Candidatus Kapaibacterium sp.]|nr:MAG: hypothetical protein KatS3mg038_3438 [Candidatus Kapabacteria bacterium]GIV55900.1 MAG: hypothetical protein KatS3mg040_0668 [Candidatus Kapabacteria bacterium]